LLQPVSLHVLFGYQRPNIAGIARWAHHVGPDSTARPGNPSR